MALWRLPATEETCSGAFMTRGCVCHCPHMALRGGDGAVAAARHRSNLQRGVYDTWLCVIVHTWPCAVAMALWRLPATEETCSGAFMAGDCVCHCPHMALRGGNGAVAAARHRRNLQRGVYDTWLCVSSHKCRVGQNHTYTVYTWYFWQGNHQIYGHIRCVYTVLANPTQVSSHRCHAHSKPAARHAQMIV
jgi:hypothetical protein